MVRKHTKRLLISRRCLSAVAPDRPRRRRRPSAVRSRNLTCRFRLAGDCAARCTSEAARPGRPGNLRAPRDHFRDSRFPGPVSKRIGNEYLVRSE